MAKKPRKHETPLKKTTYGSSLKKPASVNTKDAETLFEKVALEVLHGHRDLLDSLSATEKGTVVEWMAEAIATEDAANIVHDVLWEVDYRYKPVDIETFVRDPYYAGKVFTDENNEFAMYPLWLRDLKEVFKPRSQIVEWIFTGSIGCGKTSVAMAALMYKLYCLSCLRSPASYYSLIPGSLIVFGLFSPTKRLVADTGYFKLRGMIDTSPYFRERFPRNPKIDSQLDFGPTTGKNVKVISGSQGFHALGQDVICYSMDEANFMREKRDENAVALAGQAQEIYNTLTTRLRSRFLRAGGTLPGIMLLMSSRNSQTSFLEQKIKDGKNDSTVYISDYALWDVHPKHRYSKKSFRVEVGDRIQRSRILSPGQKPRPSAKIVQVPEDFRRQFELDIDQALRDIAGVATFNVSPFVRDRESIVEAARDKLVNPFSREAVTIDYKDDVLISEFFDVESVCRKVESRWVPRINPGAARFGHVDLAITQDCAGLAMGHVSGMVRKYTTTEDGIKEEVEDPFIIVDLMLRITPPPGSEIDFSKIRAFWLYLRRCGYHIKRITFDEYQSRDSQQILEKKGFETGTLSMDKNDHAYQSLRDAHFDRRIAMYYYKPYVIEVLDLEYDSLKHKVDHPMKSTDPNNGIGGRGSKDVADAVAGVVWNAMNDLQVRTTVPIFGRDEAKQQFTKVVDPTDDVMTQHTDQRTRLKKIGGMVVDWNKLRENVDA